MNTSAADASVLETCIYIEMFSLKRNMTAQLYFNYCHLGLYTSLSLKCQYKEKPLVAQNSPRKELMSE